MKNSLIVDKLEIQKLNTFRKFLSIALKFIKYLIETNSIIWVVIYFDNFHHYFLCLKQNIVKKSFQK